MHHLTTQNLVRWFAMRGEILCMEDVTKHPMFEVGDVILRDVRGAVSICARDSASRPIGLLLLTTPRHVQPWSTMERKFVTSVANVLGTALERIRREASHLRTIVSDI